MEDDIEQKDSRDFSPRLLEVIDQPPPPLPRVILITLILLIIAVIMWSVFGRLDIVARADGKLVPQTRIKVVQPLEDGKIARIMVKDGQLVEQGQPLLLMDTHISSADINKLRIEQDALKLQLRRISNELEGKELTGLENDDPNEYKRVLQQYQAHRGEYLHNVKRSKANLDKLQKDLSAAREIYKKLKDTLPLYVQRENALIALGTKGYISKMDINERKRERIETEQDLRAQKYVIQSLQANIRESKEQIEQLKTTYQKDLLSEQIELNRNLSQLEEDIAKQEYRNKQLTMTAPQSGYVKDLAANTVGTVIPAGSVLLNIVPVDEPLQAEVFVGNKDVGFITKGQEVRVKLMSYEFQKYGMIDAIVDNVSADAAESRSNMTKSNDEESQSPFAGYKTIINLQKQYLTRNNKQFLLRPGMQVTAEIKLGSRTVLDYILSPIERAINEAGTER